MTTAAISKRSGETASGHRAVRLDIAGLYALAAVILGAMAAMIGGLGLIFAWPALSMAGVALAYAMGWRRMFGKRRGRLPVWSLVVFGPHLLGLRIAWWIQSRGRTPCSQLLPNLWIGRRPNAQDCAELKQRGVSVTLDLTAELSEMRGLRGEGYHNLPVLDLTLPDLPTLQRAIQIIEAASRDAGVIYLHCALGYGRTAVVAAAYLLSSGRAATVEQSAEQVSACRRGSVFPPRAIAVLQQFHAGLW
jgi:protein-tyrosine phosphatase